jgi:hypothetical protein
MVYYFMSLNVLWTNNKTEYPPATSVLRSLTFGRLAGTVLAERLKASNEKAYL